MSRRITHHATELVNTSQRVTETSLSSELFAISNADERDAELDDCSKAMLIAFFMLLDKWDREVASDAEDM